MVEQVTGVEQEESIDIKAFAIRCLQRWHWFAICMLVSFLSVAVINRLAVPVYEVGTNLLIRDEENPLDPQNFIGTSLYGNPYQLQNEIGILKSKTLTAKTLQGLDFYITYFRNETFGRTSLYKSSPFTIRYDTLYDQPLDVIFNLEYLSDTLMVIRAESDQTILYNYGRMSPSGSVSGFFFHDTLSYGERTGNRYCRFHVEPNFNTLAQAEQFRRYSFRFNSLSSLIANYRVTEINAEKNSSILQIALKCANVQQGVAYLNKLSEVFLDKGIERDDKIAAATLAFIDDQLKGITDSLRYSEDRLQKFRSSRGVTNIDFQAQQTYQQMEELHNQKAEMLVKAKYYRYLKEYLMKNNRADDLIAPSSMDINDPLLNNLIIEMTRLYAERTEMSFNTIKGNPYLSSVEAKIADIKAKLTENIDNIIQSSEISLHEIDNRIRSIEDQINQLPGSQRELLVIERKFKLNDAIYTFLLTKRSEVQISKASNIPSNEVLDEASADDFAIVSPNPRMNYIVALLLGLFIPALLVYLRDLFRNKVADRKEIQGMTRLPVMGQISHHHGKSVLVVDEHPASHVAESFRTLRTNFQFYPGQPGNKIVLVTSAIKGEGKSFTAVNLATVFAQNQNRVLLIDFDLRKSKIRKYLELETNDGLSLYLSNNSSLDRIIFKTHIPNLHVIPSGPVPPNPTELIASGRTAILFDELKGQYDLIVLDTPPVALVSDAILLFSHAAIKLLVVRIDFTPRTLIASVISDLEHRNFTNLSLVINDLSDSGFGYKYTYGYSEDKSNESVTGWGRLWGK